MQRQVDMDPECAAIIAKNFDKLFDAPADPVVSAECWRRAIADIFGGDMTETVEKHAIELAREGE
jgi:hypothetical protein